MSDSITEPADHPRVVILPPIVFALALVASILLHWLLPLPLPTWLWPFGVVILIVGLGLGGATVFWFRRAATSLDPRKPDTALITGGPFRLSRNPIYVAFGLLLAGIGCALGSLWPLLVLVPFYGVIHWGVVVREERYLERRFGAEYGAYKARVRRWL
ncbi:MAG: isoprenylcysteine carboxylmethyltransferase family protein [Alphaproteobacteria bacterium]|nr:isoprenylcysteine carboxylmethyltransferase family protein [Alphaproteobacteria bacterium]